eukprot:CAMPEP_0202011194 /NCGR_PEP_ID=MMETSP0905-20130828/18756_1 /ASSEMBLY_ACC=CAM_ASM_000554 /TAXON_ID=420261 /ORGANISM="Thalassiosira antarctica, Strain CCMP982" /LENGTH=387 /DNA_ID=CAMNT_0048569953 /DNA_START=29 /DNA_END=1192 /DNA_ORIENTATION=-
MTMTMKEQQQQHHEQDRRLHDGPGLHQSTPPSGYVKPRIKAIERRMHLRTPEPKNNNHHQQRPTDNSGDNNNMTTPNNKNTTNNALVLLSPILSSILPNSNIKQFESDLLKKQAQYSARISDLDGRLALFHTRLAVECAERGREHAFTMEEYVDGPLEYATRRSLDRIQTDFVGPIMDPKRAATIGGGNPISSRGGLQEGDYGESQSSTGINEAAQEDSNNNTNNTTATTTNPPPNLVAIERRTNLLEAQMNHHKHITLFHSRRQNFDAIDRTCRQTLQPTLALEMTKADKREGGMVRRFESSAGEYTRLVSQVISGRVSSLGYVEKEMDDWDIGDLTRAEHYLQEIRRLKQRVVVEREERIRQDELVVDRIVRTKKMLEEDILLAC